MHKDFYIYEWYIEDTGHVFYVGKGRSRRFLEIHNRNKYFKNIYYKHKCNVRKIKEGLTNDEACQEEIKQIAFRKNQGEAECNFTLGGDGFSEGDLNPIHQRDVSGENNPMYGVRMLGENNHFYGKRHTEETKALISKNRQGKGARYGPDNPMWGKGLKGPDNPMYGVKGVKHPNSKMYVLEGETKLLTYKECEKRFGIAFSRIYEEGGVLHYKKNTSNKNLYEGKKLTRIK